MIRYVGVTGGAFLALNVTTLVAFVCYILALAGQAAVDTVRTVPPSFLTALPSHLPRTSATRQLVDAHWLALLLDVHLFSG